MFGPEACGKSALADMAIASVCNMGGLAVVEEFEHTRTKERLAALGADLNCVVMDTPDHLEEAWDNIWSRYNDAKDAMAKSKGKQSAYSGGVGCGGVVLCDQKDLDANTMSPGGKVAAVMASQLRAGCTSEFVMCVCTSCLLTRFVPIGVTSPLSRRIARQVV